MLRNSGGSVWAAWLSSLRWIGWPFTLATTGSAGAVAEAAGPGGAGAAERRGGEAGAWASAGPQDSAAIAASSSDGR